MTGSMCRSGLKRSTIAAIEEVFKVRIILYTKSGGSSMGDRSDRQILVVKMLHTASFGFAESYDFLGHASHHGR